MIFVVTSTECFVVAEICKRKLPLIELCYMWKDSESFFLINLSSFGFIWTDGLRPTV